jgi:hypothetical protein
LSNLAHVRRVEHRRHGVRLVGWQKHKKPCG